MECLRRRRAGDDGAAERGRRSGRGIVASDCGAGNRGGETGRGPDPAEGPGNATNPAEGMMTGIASRTITKVLDRLSGLEASNSTLAALSESAAPVAVRAQNVAAELMERSGTVQYPAVSV